MGKKSTPPAPDYTAAATATSEGNLKNVNAQTLANRVNQFTPWGSLVYDRQVTKNPITGEDEVTWNQYEDVAPELQGALQNELAISDERTQLARNMLGQVGNAYGQGFDTSSLPAIQNIDPSKLSEWQKLTADPGFGAVQEVQDAMMSRLAPDIARQRAGEIQRLKAQGITEGSMAFDKAMERLDRGETDARQQALLGAAQEYGNIFNRSAQATNMANALRQGQFGEQAQMLGLSGDERTRAFQEQAFLRNMPLNELNALLGGGQVQNPQFQGFNVAGNAAGPDFLGAANSQYQAALGAANAKNAGTAGLTSGLFGLAGSALGGPAGGFMGGLLGKAIGGQ